MKFKKIILLIVILLTTLSFGQKIKKISNDKTKELFSGGSIQIKGIDSKDIIYEYELFRSKEYYSIYFKKNINNNGKPKYKMLDSIKILKKNLKADHYFTDTGEIKIGNLVYQSLPAIVKNTKKYQGETYKTIYKAWYYDIEHEMIKEIKLPNQKLRVYDQSHD